MTHPYDGLPAEAYWRTAVADRSPFRIEGLWSPKFRIHRRTRIATAGSCFAQHFGRALAARRYRWIDAEPAPAMLAPQARLDHHYGTFSFRTGNIYTAHMLAQWMSWAAGEAPAPETLWKAQGRFFDPFRPAVEPGGFETAEDALASRAATLLAIRRAVEEAQVFVFTLGLTEAWVDRATGVEFAVCPGTLAGTFDAGRHRFVNWAYTDVRAQLKRAFRLMRTLRPDLKLLLTVSPVPLTATASGKHVLAATCYSKSVLRAAAGAWAEGSDAVDYFPSYEIITAPPFRGMFYGPNQRSVEPAGVGFVMDTFFREQAARFGRAPEDDEDEAAAAAPAPADTAAEGAAAEGAADPDEVRCEEELLDAFAR